LRADHRFSLSPQPGLDELIDELEDMAIAAE
jgi:hypothetical protein